MNSQSPKAATSVLKRICLVLAFTLSLTLPAVYLAAQAVSGDLNGTVTDPTGAVVVGATVTAENVATGLKVNATTSSTGQYRFSNLPVGRYNLSVNSPGFAAYSATGVEVGLSRVNTQNISLALGDTGTTIEVSAAANEIDTSTAQIQNTYGDKIASDNPIAGTGSGVINLSLLNAGVSSAGGIGVGTGPSVGGQRPRNNNFTVEGVDNNDKSITGPLVTIPNDAVQQFTLLQNQFSPEFGYSSGGQFNTIVKSGTNNFHGLAYIYNQNRNYEAVDFQEKTLSEEERRYDNNRYGGQIGGPVIKNKLFFFFNFERQSIGQASVAGAAFYAPTSAGFAALSGIPGVSPNNLEIFQQYVPVAPTADQAPITVGGVPIPIGTVQVSGANFSDTNTYVASGDWNITERDQLRARYIRNNFQGIDNTAQLPVFYQPVPNINNLATLSYYRTFSPKITNEFRAAFNRNENNFPSGEFAFPGLDVFPNLQFADLNDLQVGPNPVAPQGGVQNSYQLLDNVSWLVGAHTLKFGVDYRWNISPQVFTQRSRGDYYYGALEQYLFDQVPSLLGQRSTGSSVYYGNLDQIFWFVNDQWKITPNFTLNLGARYEYTGVPQGMKLQALNEAASVPGLIEFREPLAQKNNIVPRVGLAWDPFGTGNTSVRAGFGMAIDKLYDNLGLLSTPPQLGGTLDVVPTNPTTSFLASGGLPPGAGTGLNTFPTIADQRAATASYIPDQELPYSIQWNLGVQQTLFRNYTAEVRYVGTRGINLPVQQVINRRTPLTEENALPLFLSQPTQAELDALTSNLTALRALSPVLPEYLAAGFGPPDGSFITAFTPLGQSTYHALQTQLSRQFVNGLQFQAAWTYSKLIDNSTADLFSTTLNPRRPQNAQRFDLERGLSGLDRRHRVTVTALWDAQPFRGSDNWFLKNIVGNWQVSPVYTYESGQPFTVQSVVDANLDRDSAGDRAFFNPDGTGSSDVTPLTNTAGQVVGYLADDPNARYIRAGAGQLPNGPRNSLIGRPINNWDLSVVKRFNFTETTALELHGQAFNLFNHPQFIAGYISDVQPRSTNLIPRSFVQPGDPNFNDPTSVFSNNPRFLQLALKVIF